MDSDVSDLAVLESSPAVRAAEFTFVELTIAKGVATKVRNLLQGVLSMCRSHSTIKMLVIRVPEDHLVRRTLGLGSPLKEVLTNFQQRNYAQGLTTLPRNENAAY